MPLLRCPRDGAGEQRNETPRGCHARAALPSGSRSVGTLLMQSSFKAGDLEWSLPALAVANPVVSVIAGTVAFHEHLSAPDPRYDPRQLGSGPRWRRRPG